VTDLPVFAPVVIEARQYAATCVRCGERTVGSYPAGLEPHRMFGPGAGALLSYFHERHHVSYERLVEVCRDVFGLAIQPGRGRKRPAPAGRAGAADVRGDRRPHARALAGGLDRPGVGRNCREPGRGGGAAARSLARERRDELPLPARQIEPFIPVLMAAGLLRAG
jgi:hypothetical protein